MSPNNGASPGRDGGCPYNGLPERAFFRNETLRRGNLAFDQDPGLSLLPSTRVMSAGSCFAARIADFIRSSGINYLSTDDRIAVDDAVREETPNVFSLRYGNIYTTRHLLQLLQRATGALSVAPPVTRDGEGRYRNLLRPSVLSYASPTILLADDASHLRNVATMIGQTDVFIFTLGLTEYWKHLQSGLALPATPGCGHGAFDAAQHAFHNATLDEVVDELEQSIDCLRRLNPAVQVLLTLSPVPLVATYTPVSAVEATFYSKSLMRQAIAVACASRSGVSYFPSYEIITNPHVIREHFAADMRSVSDAGVARVMAHFRARYVAADDSQEIIAIPVLSDVPSASVPVSAAINPVCDEENIWTSYLNRKGA
jgi:hypothetical protein